ncbi:MAG: hypothetical protein WDO13_18855 [Verrucomicrobiota bacterium]
MKSDHRTQAWHLSLSAPLLVAAAIFFAQAAGLDGSRAVPVTPPGVGRLHLRDGSPAGMHPRHVAEDLLRLKLASEEDLR